MRELLIRDRDLAELFLAGMRELDSLHGADTMRFELLLRNMFTEFQGAYIRHLSIGDDPNKFEGPGRMIERILENDDTRRFLQQSENDWRPKFRAFVDARIAAIDKRRKS